MKGNMFNPKLEALQKMQQAQYGEYLKGLQNYGAPNDAGVPALPGGTPQEDMSIEMGPPKIEPELELEMGPPKVQPQLDMKFGGPKAMPDMELLFGKPRVAGRRKETGPIRGGNREIDSKVFEAAIGRK